ncbi:MAG: penicillin-binding protein 2, partial [Alphaproteobacteria bacterium]|nr:penicillin-binding protein 2 [Alphaproteobacteria bacterium]
MGSDHEQQEQTINRRGVIMLGGAFVGFGVLAARLFYLQIQQVEYYRTEAERNRTNLEILLPKRGAILDERGRKIADSIIEYDLYLLEKYSKLTAKQLTEVLSYLRLGQPSNSALLDLILTNNRRPLLLMRNISAEQLMRLEFHRAELPDFAIRKQVRRHYFMGSALSPITGYVGRASESDRGDRSYALMEEYRLGKAGIERQYEDYLHGDTGTAAIKVDVYGERLQELDRTESRAGANLQLHVNTDLQEYTMQLLADHRSGAVVVLDALNGGVKALASYPFYDANEFKTKLLPERWHSLTNDPSKPMVNKTLAGVYSPGSTFKPIVALAALRAGIDPSKQHYCNGFMSLGNARFHCWKKQGHGYTNLQQAIIQSCDVWFYQTARQLGIAKIAKMARELGLGALSGIDLENEKDGLIPDAEWKRKTLNAPFYPGEIVIYGIGHGFILSTPLQLARAYASFINGGYLLTPQLAHRVQQSNHAFKDLSSPTPHKIAVPEAHLHIVREALINAVNTPRGTAWRSRLNKDLGFAMAGKTGTTQVR